MGIRMSGNFSRLTSKGWNASFTIVCPWAIVFHIVLKYTSDWAMAPRAEWYTADDERLSDPMKIVMDLRLGVSLKLYARMHAPTAMG